MVERLVSPGTPDGPCLEACEHLACRLAKILAEQQCIHCGDIIGFGRRFYRILGDPSDERWEAVAHALCLEIVAGAEAEGRGDEVRARMQRLRQAARREEGGYFA